MSAHSIQPPHGKGTCWKHPDLACLSRREYNAELMRRLRARRYAFGLNNHGETPKRARYRREIFTFLRQILNDTLAPASDVLVPSCVIDPGCPAGRALRDDREPFFLESRSVSRLAARSPGRVFVTTISRPAFDL